MSERLSTVMDHFAKFNDMLVAKAETCSPISHGSSEVHGRREEVDDTILETDVDEAHCPQQLADIPVPQVAERIVEIVTAFHRSESRNDSLHRSSTGPDNTHSGGEDHQTFPISRSELRTHRKQRLSQDTIQQ